MVERIGKFDKVTISTDGPDVLLQLPARLTRAHWGDVKQIADGLYIAIRQAQYWEEQNALNGGRKN